MTHLTRREEECLNFIVAYVEREGVTPFQKEIAEHLGSTSRGFIYRALKSLEDKGYIRIHIFRRRGIELTSRRPVSVTVQIPIEVWAAYQRAAKRERTTPETIVRQIIRDAAEGEASQKEAA